MAETKTFVYIKQRDKLIEFIPTNSAMHADMHAMHHDKAEEALRAARRGTHAVFQVTTEGKTIKGERAEYTTFFDPPIICDEAKRNFLEAAVGGFVYSAVKE